MKESWEEVREIILHHESNETEESQQEHGGKGKPDEVGSTWGPQTGDVAACGNWHDG